MKQVIFKGFSPFLLYLPFHRPEINISEHETLCYPEKQGVTVRHTV